MYFFLLFSLSVTVQRVQTATGKVWHLSAGLCVTMAHACGFPVGRRTDFLTLAVHSGDSSVSSVNQALSFSTRGAATLTLTLLLKIVCFQTHWPCLGTIAKQVLVIFTNIILLKTSAIKIYIYICIYFQVWISWYTPNISNFIPKSLLFLFL